MEAAEHPVADGHALDLVADRQHGADELVADREAGLDRHAAVVDVEVGAADAARLDLDDRLVGGRQLGIGLLLDPDLAGAWKVTARIARNRTSSADARRRRAPGSDRALTGLAVSAIRASSASSFSKSAASPCWKETSSPSSSSMKISTKRRVELLAGDATKLLHRLIGRGRRAVGVAGRHHVIGVGDGDDPRQLRDVIARQAARVAFAVDSLVVGEDDLGDRPIAVERGDDAGALLGVAADQHPVLVGERHVGLQDAVGEDELADVVQQRGDVD